MRLLQAFLVHLLRWGPFRAAATEPGAVRECAAVLGRHLQPKVEGKRAQKHDDRGQYRAPKGLQRCLAHQDAMSARHCIAGDVWVFNLAKAAPSALESAAPAFAAPRGAVSPTLCAAETPPRPCWRHRRSLRAAASRDRSGSRAADCAAHSSGRRARGHQGRVAAEGGWRQRAAGDGRARHERLWTKPLPVLRPAGERSLHSAICRLVACRGPRCGAQCRSCAMRSQCGPRPQPWRCIQARSIPMHGPSSRRSDVEERASQRLEAVCAANGRRGYGGRAGGVHAPMRSCAISVQ